MPLTGSEGSIVVDGDDRLYRYYLTREIGEGNRVPRPRRPPVRRGRVAFVMLNPSTASESENDPTVERCIQFAQKWGFQTLEVGNLYAWYATDPTELLDAPPQTGGPIGPHNDTYLHCLATRCSKVVTAWGNNASKKRANHVLRLLWDAMKSAGHAPRIHRLGDATQKGHPRHPLFESIEETPCVQWHGHNGLPPQIK